MNYMHFMYSGIKRSYLDVFNFLWFTIFLTTVSAPFISQYPLTPVPVSGEIISDIDFTVWTNGVSFWEGEVIDFSFDLSTIYLDPVTVSIVDLNGSFSIVESVDPTTLNGPYILHKTVESGQSDMPGIHLFMISCSQHFSEVVQYFPVYLNPDPAVISSSSGLTLNGESPMALDAGKMYYFVDEGQTITVNVTLLSADTFPYFYTDGNELFYLRREISGDVHEFYCSNIAETGLFGSLTNSFTFRVPSFWTEGEYSLTGVFTGSFSALLEPAFSDTITINSVATVLGIELEASSNTVERNNLTQDNLIDYDANIIGYAGQNFLLSSSINNAAGTYFEDIFTDQSVSSFLYSFSYRPDHLIDLGFYTLTVELLDPSGGLIDVASHGFKIVDQVDLSDYYVNNSLPQPGDTVAFHFTIREQDKPIPVACNVSVKVKNTSDLWELIYYQPTTVNGEVDFSWKIPLSTTSTTIPIRIEAIPADTDEFHLPAVFTRYLPIVTSTVINHDEPLAAFRGEEVLFEAEVYNIFYQPIYSGTVSLHVGEEKLISFHQELNDTNWNDIKFSWNIPSNYTTGIETCYWEFSGNGYNLPVIEEFNIAIWSIPHVDSLYINNSAAVFGETIKITATVIDETNSHPQGLELTVEFTIRFEGNPVKELFLTGVSSEATGTASVTVNTADQFFSRGNYLVIAKILPDEVNFIAESMHQEERRFTVTDGFNLQWLNNDIPVVNISQQFVIRGRSNAILTLYLTDSNGTSYELYPVTLDFEGYYKGNITFDAKGNYSLYVVPEYYEDSSYYNPIHKTIYGVQYLTWSIHPLSREELIPNQQNIDYLNITVNEVLDLLITGESPYELWLNGGLSLSYNYSRVFVYNFTRKGIYTIILKGTDPTCWSVNYTCIVSVYEPLIVEVSLPQSAVESQAIVAGLVVRSISEGPVPGVEIDFHVISNETGTGPAFTGTTDSYGKREFQIAYLSAGIYSVYLSLTPPEGSFYSFDNNATFWGYLFVWSSTTIEVNHFMTSYGKNVSVTAVIKSSSGTGISNVPVSFYYYNDSITDAVFIGTSITDSNGTSTITWIVNLDPGEYYLSVELDSTWPYDSSKQTTTFKVTGDPPTITNFRIVFVGQDSGSYYFLATVMIDASNAVSRVNLTLNSSVFHLTETNKGYWQVSFQVEPGNYSVVVSVVDKYGYSDSYKIDRYQLLPENTDEYIDSSTNNGSNSSTSSNNLENNLKTSYLEDSMTLVLIGMGFLVFFLKKREKMFV